MKIRNVRGIYHVLAELVQKSPHPITCTEAYDSPAVREYCNDVNRLSDYMGHMYRQGHFGRVPAPRTETSSARWAYFWKDQQTRRPPTQRNAQPRLSLVQGGEKLPHNITVSKDGSTVTVDLPTMLLTIKIK